MVLTVLALRLAQHGDTPRRLIEGLSASLRAAGVLELPLLVSLEDDRDVLVLVGFGNRVAAEADHVQLARAALAKACAGLGIVASPLERYTERIGAGAASHAGYYRLAICEREVSALRAFAERSATASTTPTPPGLLWIGRAEQSETALVLTGYPDDSAFRDGRPIEDAPDEARRALRVRLYASERRGMNSSS